MQAVFIKNIKDLVGRSIINSDGVVRHLQTIISTHSSHIVSESDFDDIKYFQRSGGQTWSRNLKFLKGMYEDAGHPGHYRFLKQYLTLNRSQLFFADKAILVEGDTERILLPAMMRKIDQFDAQNAWTGGTFAPLPLLSQNISVIEVGAHSHIYEIFLDFIGVKTLIITDIDSGVKKDELDKDGNVKFTKNGEAKKKIEAHPIDGATHTTNYALQFYHSKGPDIAYYIGLTMEQKTVGRDATGKWSAEANGQVMCAFQVCEADHAGNQYHS
jgi:predicted ATP-dependent endonuclease of OLD family